MRLLCAVGDANSIVSTTCQLELRVPGAGEPGYDGHEPVEGGELVPIPLREPEVTVDRRGPAVRRQNRKLREGPVPVPASDLVRAAFGEPDPVWPRDDSHRPAVRRRDGELGDDAAVADAGDLGGVELGEPEGL